MATLRIGTSGWNYRHWRELFYPDDVSQRRWLEFYADHFNTAEVNYSFYRLPNKSTYENWKLQVQPDFLFTLKCSRIITHNKRLGNLKDLWVNFLNNAVVLDRQLGPILCQFPETFSIDTARLESFLSTARHAVDHDLNIRLAVEFRNASWFKTEVYRLLEKYNVALVTADSSLYPRSEHITADFAYFRYHGPGLLFGSSYTRSRLEQESKLMERALRQGADVFAYFNNDGHAFAVKNALLLRDLLKEPQKRKAG